MSQSQIDEIRRGIDALRTARPVIHDMFWGGADVVITPEPIPENPDAFYPPPRQFVTRHAGEATWLFMSLRDLFSPLLDAGNKYEFYARLAIAGERHPDSAGMRNAILDEASHWLDEVSGDFERTLRDTRIH